MSHLLSAMTIECDYGTQVPLMLTGYRKIPQVEGLAGVTTRARKTPRTGGHGVINRTAYRDEATIVLACLFLDEYTNSSARAWDEYYEVARAANSAVDTPRTLRWTAGNLDLQASVRLDESRDGIEVGPALVRAQFTFSIPDSRVLSQTEHEAFVAVLGT